VTVEAGVLQAAREDAISNKLKPRSTGSSLREDKRLVLSCGLNEAQCIDEVDFGGSLRAYFCIYVHLDERRPGAIVFLYALNLSSRGHANVGLVKALLAQSLIGT
jgi:hypothetical protein